MDLDYLTRILTSQVYDVAVRTDLQRAVGLSDRLGNDVWFKREDQQPIYSFKIRGAYNKMASLSAEERDAGVITASAGNHAQGVAFSCKLLNIKGVIYMPAITPKQKINQVRMFGGDNIDIVLDSVV